MPSDSDPAPPPVAPVLPHFSRRRFGALALHGAAALALGAGPGRAAPRSPRRRVVVVGGHPDDPEAGMGGTMARLAAAGHAVHVLYLTRGEAGIPGVAADEAARVREAEARRACALTGATPHFVGQLDGQTRTDSEARAHFEAALLGLEPEVVFTHWPLDFHVDHRAAAELTFGAWAKKREAFCLYFYEVMSGWQSQTFHPTHWVDVTKVAATKKEACFAHASQKPDEWWPHHEKMLGFRGLEIIVGAAEAFVHHAPSPTDGGLLASLETRRPADEKAGPKRPTGSKASDKKPAREGQAVRPDATSPRTR